MAKNTLERKDYSQSERDAMDDSDFGDPENQAFPIKTAADVIHAAERLHNSKGDQEAIKARIKRIAKRKGFPLPQTWQDDNKDNKERSMGAEHIHEALTRADGNHEPMTGTHSHVHPAFGSQGDDASHEHEHEHANDNVHDHAHMHAHRAAMPTGDARMYAPIVRIDAKKWEVEGVATSEEVDSFGTIFSYEASKKAFQDWSERSANVREMHDRKAVGKGINWWPDDANRKIHVLLRVSRGAPDTWLKVEDGVLNGLSVGATEPLWGTIERNGKVYPYLKSYKLAELSLVDNASNPDAQGLVIARADGLTELVDLTEDVPLAGIPVSPVERAGARVSSSTRGSMHESIAHTLRAAMSQMKNCGCENCTGAMRMIDPDEDGDIDLGGMDDPDGDWQSLYSNKDGETDRTIEAALERLLPGAIERILAPIYQRQQHFLARLAQLPEQTNSPIDTTPLEERITALIERVASASSLSDVRAELSAVKETVERIERQPAVGLAPILNGSRPVEKTFPLDRATQPAATPVQASTVAGALNAMQGAGLLDSQDLQMKAASLLLQMQQPR